MSYSAKILLDSISETGKRIIGWKQFRKEFADENCTNFRKEN